MVKWTQTKVEHQPTQGLVILCMHAMNYLWKWKTRRLCRSPWSHLKTRSTWLFRESRFLLHNTLWHGIISFWGEFWSPFFFKIAEIWCLCRLSASSSFSFCELYLYCFPKHRSSVINWHISISPSPYNPTYTSTHSYHHHHHHHFHRCWKGCNSSCLLENDTFLLRFACVILATTMKIGRCLPMR